ncbi:MAG: SdrD B-like domain-containing protein, partial [Cyanobacteria bacterium J06559_3]
MPLNESVFSDATVAIAPTRELDLTNGYTDASVLPDTAVGAAANAAVLLDEPVSSLASLLTSQAVLVGSEADETLVGTSASEVIEGQSGHDVLTGMGGQDVFIFAPDSGTDTITDFGGVGSGSTGDPALLPEADILQFEGDDLTAENLLLSYDGQDTVLSFAGVPGLQVILQNFDFTNLDNLSDGVGNILFEGQTEIVDAYDVADDNTSRNPGVREDTVTYLNNARNQVSGRGSDDVINGLAGDDQISGGNGSDRLRGQAGLDNLSGGSGNDILEGGEGNDRLQGGNDNDELFGGLGRDNLAGGNDNDRLEGGADNDTLNGGRGNDVLRGQAGNDQIRGADGEDVLEGGDGSDRLFGGRDNDRLDGGLGRDNLAGEDGDDVLLIYEGPDQAFGGNGRDEFWVASQDFPAESSRVRDFQPGQDVIVIDRLPNVNAFADLELRRSGRDTVVKAQGQFLVTLSGVQPEDLTEGDFRIIPGGGSNEPPVVEPNKTLTVDEDSSATALNIGAPTDADGDALTVTITEVPLAAQGTVQLADGTPVAVNQVLTVDELQVLQFVPEPNANGDAGIFAYRVEDGQGGAASQHVFLAITPINDAPVLTVPDAQTTPDNTALPISGIRVTDIDVAAGELEVSLTVTEGGLSLSEIAGLTFNSGDGTDDAALTFTGSLTDINAALDTLSYRSAAGLDGQDTLNLTVSDLGNTGAGGALTDSAAIALNITAASASNTVTGTVFLDENGNAALDGSEVGQAGITVFLDLNQNGFLNPGEPSQVTDSDGQYRFEDAPSGSYLVWEEVPDGFEQTAPESFFTAVELTGNTTIADVNFGNQAFVFPTGTGEITGFKWEDINANGIRDTELVQGSNPDIVFVIDVSGSADFNFVGSDIGDFNGDGRANTRLDAEIAGFIALNDQLVAQGLGAAAEVGIVVFSGFAAQADMNTTADGVQLLTTPLADEDDNGVSDVEDILRSLRSGAFGVGNNTGTNFEVALRDVEDTFNAVDTPVGSGNVVFLSDGEVNRGGSIADEIERLSVLGVNISAFGVGSDASLRDLQNVDPDAEIFVTAEELVDVFSNLDAGDSTFVEPTLEGFTVYLDLNENGQLDQNEPTQVTDADGNYRFTGLAAGTYQVREIQQSGFGQTFPFGEETTLDDGSTVVLPGFHTVTVAEGEVADNFNFGNKLRTGEIRGVKWEDLNGDGVFDDDEPNLEGVTVYLDLNQNGRIDINEPNQQTDANGRYRFRDLDTGTYLIREIVPLNFAQTAPTDFYEIELGIGEVVEDINFGNVQRTDPLNGEIRGLKWEDLDGDGIRDLDPGSPEPGLKDWLIYIDTDNDGERDANERFTLTNDNGGYVFADLDPGTYVIREELQPGWVQTSSPEAQTLTIVDGEVFTDVDFGNQRIVVGNQSPMFTSEAVTTATPGELYQYGVEAVDPEGTDVTYALREGFFPTGMVLNPVTGLIEWSVDASQSGSFPVTVLATDADGIQSSQSFLITTSDVPGGGSSAPEIEFGFSSNSVAIGEDFNLQIRGVDSEGLASLELSVNGTPVALDSSDIRSGAINGAALQFTEAGLVDIVATATDTNGNTSTQTLTIRVTDPTDTTGPVTELDLTQFEGSGSVITTPTDIIGTVDDDSLEFYRLEIAPIDLVNPNNPAAPDADYRVLAEGTGNVDGVLGQVDPTLLANGNYFLRVVTGDLSGNVNAQGTTVSIAGDLKPGRFTQEFVDLSVPVAGLPIEVTRVYDSLEANRSSDFGFGWSLGEQDAQIQESVPVTESSLFSFFTENSFEVGSTVTLTNPEGRRVTFTFDPVVTGFSLFGPIWSPRFVPEPGVFDTLEVDNVPLSVRSDGTVGLFLFSFFSYNPSEYRLTTRDGTTYQYDQFDGLENVTDRNGNTLTYTDNGIFSSTGESVQFLRDGQGRITEIVDPAGNSIEYGYDVSGDLVTVTDREDNTTELVYEEPQLPHYLSDIIDALGRGGIRNEYDDQGRLVRLIDADGNALDVTFDGANLQTVTDPLGNTITFIFDERGNLVQQVDAEGGITLSTYDENDNLTSTTDPLGNITTFTYDARGNMLTETDPLGNTTTFTYNQFSQVLTTVDALRFATTNEYDADGNLTQTTDAEGNSVTNEYDDSGNLVQVTDASGNVTTFDYNTFGLITQITDSEGGVGTFGYDSRGNVISLTTPRGVTSTFSYDNENRLTIATDALGNASTIEYDAAGQRTATVDALGRRTEFTYNDRGLLETTTFPDGTIETLVYDALDRQTAMIDRNGNRTEFQYDALDRLIGVVDALNNQTTYERDLSGNIIEQTDAEGRTTTFTYDALDHIVTTTLPLGQNFTNSYDAVGNLIQTNDFNGDILNHAYDGLGQLTATSLADGTAVESFTYTPTGQIATTQDERGLTEFTYNGLDRLTRRIDPDGTEIAYLYDADGNVVSLTTPAGTVQYTYDALNFLDTVTDREGAVTDYDYDAVDNLIQTTFANGVVETRKYDVSDRVEELTTVDGDGDVLASYAYTFDNVGNRLSETDSTGRVTEYDYDVLSRVMEVEVTDSTLGDETTAYNYDDAGNILTKTDSNGTTTYTYDDNDRLIQEEINGQ